MSDRNTHEDVDVVVVGGGVVGCAIARALAPDQSVVLLDSGDVGGGASGQALGLATTAAAYADRPGIARYAIEWFRSLDGVAIDERASVEPASSGDGDLYRRRARRLADAGGNVRFQSVDESHPRLRFPGTDGSIRYEPVLQVDPTSLVTALAADAAVRGATVRTGVRVTGIRAERRAGQETVTGVETATGSIGASQVVVAAGWQTPSLLSEHLALPVRSYRTQGIDLLADRPLPRSLPAVWHPDAGIYWRERNGRLWVGGGAHALSDDDAAAASRDADQWFREHATSVVAECVIDAAPFTVVRGWAGIDCGTPDGRPIVDHAGRYGTAPEGLFVATGFHGMGVGLAPVAAAIVRSLVDGSDAPVPLDPFALDRFEDRSRSFEFVEIPEERSE